jgi:DNA-binding transcriptional LysR family regulator
VKFAERYPDLDLQLVATARLFSLSKREADIAISLSMPKEGRIRAVADYIYETVEHERALFSGR